MRYNSDQYYHAPNYFGYYWGFLLPDLLTKLRKLPTDKNKQKVHKEFKRYLGVKSIAGMTDQQMRRFIDKILMVAAREKGIFIRTSPDQPELIEDMPLGECWDVL